MRNIIFLLITIFGVLLNNLSFGQNTLPDIDAKKEEGLHVLKWINPYTKDVKSVIIERSKEETKNFNNIGRVEKLSNANQYFVDVHPLLGDNYYRVKVIFKSNIEWISNTVLLSSDSIDISKTKDLPSNEQFQEILEDKGKEGIKEFKEQYYPTSKYIFTNPFTGNINIEIPNAIKNRYNIIFYTLNDKEVLNIERIREDTVIIDKRNFQQLGVYKFKILRDKELYEEGYITIN